jgi:hypothetical protein
MPKPKKQFLTIPQIEFCAWRARGASLREATRWAGFPHKYDAHHLERQELVKEKIEEFRKQYEEAGVEHVEHLRATLREFGVGELIHRARTVKTHKIRGDDAIVRLIQIAVKAGGLLPEATKISVSAQAAAAAMAKPATAIEVYEAEWMAERKAGMSKRLEQKYGLPSDTSPS